jgi:hypothetical protein
MKNVSTATTLASVVGALAVLVVLIVLSKLINRPGAPMPRRTEVKMRKAAVQEMVRVQASLRRKHTVEVVQHAARGALSWSRNVEQVLHDLAYGIGCLKMAHLTFGHDEELRSELSKHHVNFDDLFLELETTTRTIVAAIDRRL